MYPQTTKERGIKKIESPVGPLYYLSANAKDLPTKDHSRAIEDDIALAVAAEFVEHCDGSSAQVGAQLVHMHHNGGIKHHTDRGPHFFHIRRRNGSKVALEIVY